MKRKGVRGTRVVAKSHKQEKPAQEGKVQQWVCIKKANHNQEWKSVKSRGTVLTKVAHQKKEGGQ